MTSDMRYGMTYDEWIDIGYDPRLAPVSHWGLVPSWPYEGERAGGKEGDIIPVPC